MSATTDIPRPGLGDDPDAVISQLYSLYARALRRYVERSFPDPASAEDIVQETLRKQLQEQDAITGS
jgi:DNA-directed RNA polymerase specialized sigma24 family protein